MSSFAMRRGLLLGLLLVLLVPPVDGGAIPAFARKYKVSCALCHNPFPRLNEFGETFAGNGFRMAVGEPAVDTVSAGDALLRLQSAIPLAVRIDASARQTASPVSAGRDPSWALVLTTRIG